MQKGAEKTPSVCHSKWANLKSAYSAVLKVKRASGFTWSDEHGAGITLESESAWVAFVKCHAAAKPFKNRGFPFFDLIDSIQPRSKRQGNNSNIYCSPSGLDGMPSIITSGTLDTLNQLNHSLNEINISTSMWHNAPPEATGPSPPISHPPMSSPGSVPSTFLSGSTDASSVVTSVSHNSKCKHDNQSAFDSAVASSGGAPKHSRPILVAAKA
ncbi:hypothetical protein BDR07DRAFT_1488708 [Suillus spraguei]|nr:hypothetical protein BDR07DRAFT_1488708 [Suillus spraguei]